MVKSSKTDKRIIWKNENDLSLMTTISRFIETHQIKSIRQYQDKLKVHPNEAPSVWFITQRFRSWENLMSMLGGKVYDRYRWDKIPDEEFLKLVQEFIKTENIKSQRAYEKSSVKRNVPSLSTVKKRIPDVKSLFVTKKRTERYLTDLELLYELKNEIIKLGLEESLSMIEFRKLTKSSKLPSVDTIKRRTGLNWEELMAVLGYDYRKIKTEKMLDNFKK